MMVVTFVNEGQILPQLPSCVISSRGGTTVIAVANGPWESVEQAESFAQRCIDAGMVTHREAFMFWQSEQADGRKPERELPGWE